MTVAVNDTIERYTITGAGPYAYTWRIFNDTDLQVYALSGASPPVPTLLSYLTHYTVAGANDAGGGSITLTAAAIAAFTGYTLDIRANTPRNQPTSIRNQARFLPEIHEDAFDYLDRQIQDVGRLVDASIRSPDNEPTLSMVLPPVASRIGQYLAFDSNGQPVPSSGTGNDSALRTDLANGTTAGMGSSLVANTKRTWETNQGVTITDFSRDLIEIDPIRYGILPNNIALAGTNATALNKLLDPLVAAGFTGTISFMPIIGGDTYHFNAPIVVRPGVKLKLNGCRLLHTVTAAAGHLSYGCWNAIRDFIVDLGGGTIEANITGTTSANTLPLFRLGSRYSYPFGSFTNGIFDKTDLYDAGLPAQGNIWITGGGRLKTNNPSGNCLVMGFLIGGLRNVLIENHTLEGNGNTGPETGWYYEMGDGSQNGFPSTPARWSTSSARNLCFRNIHGKNLKTVGATVDANVVNIVEAANYEVSNITGDGTTFGLFGARPGEGHFFREWTGVKQGIGRISGVEGSCTGTAMNLEGAAETTVGQFSDANMLASGQAVLTPSQKVDLMHYTVVGCNLRPGAGGTGMNVSGPIVALSNTIRGGLEGLTLRGECVSFYFAGTRIFDTSGNPVRANIDSTIFSRKKIGRFVAGKIGGGVGVALLFDFTRRVYIGQNQIGYNTAYDNANEATQTNAVLAGANADGVVVEGNFATTSGGAAAYAKTGAANGCTFVSGDGTKSISGNWLFGGTPIQNNLNFAAPTNIDCANGQIVNLNVNGGGAFTINAPTNLAIGPLTIFVQNTSGGAMGAITWNAIFKLAGAFVNPANGQQRGITFMYDGTSLHEVSRNAADVPL